MGSAGVIRAFLVVLAVLAASFAADPAHAQRAWVKDEVRLNLRTGPSNKYRIVGAIRTGDSVTILNHGEGWTQVRRSDAREGWVPEGFLAEKPPAMTRVARMENETLELRETIESARKELQELRTDRERLVQSDGEQRERINVLETENIELKAGARWPEWITGAGILASGMLVGAILQQWSARRPRSRIRL